jgi:chromosome segregation ATPase
MRDGSVPNLAEEWKLLWESLWGDEEGEKELLDLPSFLTKDKIKQLKKDLSKHRQTLNRELEKIKKEIEQINETIEAQKVVRGQTDEHLQSISQLSERGQELTNELTKVNKKLSWVRAQEKKIPEPPPADSTP